MTERLCLSAYHTKFSRGYCMRLFIYFMSLKFFFFFSFILMEHKREFLFFSLKWITYNEICWRKSSSSFFFFLRYISIKYILMRVKSIVKKKSNNYNVRQRTCSFFKIQIILDTLRCNFYCFSRYCIFFTFLQMIFFFFFKDFIVDQ